MEIQEHNPMEAPEQAAPETEAESAERPQENEQARNPGPGKPSWEEILQDEEYRKCYDAAVQGIVQRRLRGRAEAEETLRSLAPVLEALRERYGEEKDAGTLAGRIRGDGLWQGQEIGAHLEALLQEAEALRQTLPEFDLLRELEDPGFLRLTAPHSGVSLADAYYARHRGEIGERAARQSLEAFSRSLQSGAARPRENHGGRSAGHPESDPRAMSRAEREALKRRIRQAGAQGRKLSVGE